MIDRPITRADWTKFGLWAVFYPIIILAFDYWLHRHNFATITNASRRIFHLYPITGFLAGMVFVGLLCHFFVTYRDYRKGRAAFLWCLFGGAIMGLVLFFFLYG